MHQNQDGSYTLSSGRRVQANRGIFGLGPDCGADGSVPEGYDGAIVVDGRFADVADTPEEARQDAAWTVEERAELAQEMIRRWLQFAIVPGAPEVLVRLQAGVHYMRAPITTVTVTLQPGPEHYPAAAGRPVVGERPVEG